MKASKKASRKISMLLLVGVFLSTVILAIVASPITHGDTVTKDATATHQHTWIWKNVDIGDTYLYVHWTYRQYFVGHHIVYSEIVDYDSPVYIAEKERPVDWTSSSKGVDTISAHHEYEAWGETTWYVNVGFTHKKVVTRTAIHFTDHGSSWSEDKWIQYP